MTKESQLHKLNRKFPVEMNKTNTSNLTLTNDVFIHEFKDLIHENYITRIATDLDRPIKIWKTQNTPGEYYINVEVHIPYLKSVTITSSELIMYADETTTKKFPYTEVFSEEDQVEIFTWTSPLLRTPEIIPSCKFEVNVKTFEELEFEKGYPETQPIQELEVYKESIDDDNSNLVFKTDLKHIYQVWIFENKNDNKGWQTIIDYTPTNPIDTYETILKKRNIDLLTNSYYFQVVTDNFGNYFQVFQGYNINKDIYYHDTALDRIGELLNVPRRKYINKYDYQTLEDYYHHVNPSKTVPSYFNEPEEADYEYENRIREYIDNYSTEYLPVLELKKLYSINSSLINRKEILVEQDVDTMWEEGCYDPNDTTEKEDTTLIFLSNSLFTVNESKTLTLKVTSTTGKTILDGTIHLKIGSNSYNLTVHNSIATKTLTFPQANTYTCEAVFEGNSDYNSSSVVKQDITVKLKQPVINCPAVTGNPGNTVELLANVTYPEHFDENGKQIIINEGVVRFNIADKLIAYSDVNKGIAKVNYTIPKNNPIMLEQVTAIYSGTNDYNTVTDVFNLNIIKEKIKTHLQAFTIPRNIVGGLLYEQSGKTLTGKVLKVQVNGITKAMLSTESTQICYTDILNYVKQETDTEGNITVTGDIVNLIYEGDTYYEPCSIQVYPTINAQEKTVRDVHFQYVYVYPSIIVCKVFDEYNHPVTGGKIYFNKNGSTVTGGEQKATLNGWNKIDFGDYLSTDVFTIQYAGIEGKYNSKLITINTSISTLKDPTLTFKMEDINGNTITSVDNNTTIYLTGTLKDANTSLVNEPIELWVDNHLAVNNTADINAITDSTGVYKIPYTPSKAGSISLTIKYPGNDTYKATTLTQTLTVNTVKIPTSITPISKTDTNFTFGLYDANGNVLNGKTVNATVNDTVMDTATTNGASSTITIPTNPANDIILEFSGDNNYKSCVFNITQWTPGGVPEIETDITPIINITANNPTFYVGMDLELVITVMNPNYTSSSSDYYIPGLNVHLYDKINDEIVYAGKTDSNGKLVYKKTNLPAGNYKFTASTEGYEKYQPVTSADYIFTLQEDSAIIQKTLTSLNCNITGNTIHVGDNVILTASVVGETGAVNTGTVTFYKEINGEKTTLNTATVNSKGIAEYSFNLTEDKATVDAQHYYATYNGTPLFKTSTTYEDTTNYFLTRIKTNLTLTASSKNILTGSESLISYGINISVDKLTNKSVTLYADGTSYYTGNLASISPIIKYSSLNSGDHTLTLKYNGGGLYESSSTSIIITVVSAQTKPTITIYTATNNNKCYYGENVYAKLSVGETALSGYTLGFKFGQNNVYSKEYSAVTDSEGVAYIGTASVSNVNGGTVLIGNTYNVTVSYTGNTDLYTNSSNSTNITVTKRSTAITLETSRVTRGDYIYAKVTMDTFTAGLPVDFTLTNPNTGASKTYTNYLTNDEGKAQLPITLVAGTYNVTATVQQNAFYYGNSTDGSLVVTDSCNLEFVSKTVVYKESLICKMTNSSGTPIGGKTLSLKLKNTDGEITYTLTTDSNGLASKTIETNPTKGLTATLSINNDTYYENKTTGEVIIDYQKRESAIYTNQTTLVKGNNLNSILYDLSDSKIDGKTLAASTRLTDRNVPVTLKNTLTGASKTYDSTVVSSNDYNTITGSTGQNWIKVSIVGKLTYKYVFAGDDYYKSSSTDENNLNVTN